MYHTCSGNIIYYSDKGCKIEHSLWAGGSEQHKYYTIKREILSIKNKETDLLLVRSDCGICCAHLEELLPLAHKGTYEKQSETHTHTQSIGLHGEMSVIRRICLCATDGRCQIHAMKVNLYCVVGFLVEKLWLFLFSECGCSSKFMNGNGLYLT